MLAPLLLLLLLLLPFQLLDAVAAGWRGGMRACVPWCGDSVLMLFRHARQTHHPRPALATRPHRRVSCERKAASERLRALKGVGSASHKGALTQGPHHPLVCIPPSLSQPLNHWCTRAAYRTSSLAALSFALAQIAQIALASCTLAAYTGSDVSPPRELRRIQSLSHSPHVASARLQLVFTATYSPIVAQV